MRKLIDAHRDTFGVEPICKVLQISPSGYRRHAALQRNPHQRCARAQRDDVLASEIERVWEANMRVYGADKVWRQLAREGMAAAGCTGGPGVGWSGRTGRGPQAQAGRWCGGQRVRRSGGIGVQRRGATEDRGDRVRGDPDHVDLGLLRGELHAGGLCMESQHQRPGVLGIEALPHHSRPDSPGGPELCDLLQQRGAGDEEE